MGHYLLDHGWLPTMMIVSWALISVLVVGILMANFWVLWAAGIAETLIVHSSVAIAGVSHVSSYQHTLAIVTLIVAGAVCGGSVCFADMFKK